MENVPTITEISDKIRILNVHDERFKTCLISVNMRLPLLHNTAANMVLSSLLAHSSRRYPTIGALGKRLDALYGAQLDSRFVRQGEGQLLQLCITCIDDRFSLDGESITKECLSLLLELLFDPNTENGSFTETDTQREKRLAIEELESEKNDKRAYALSRCTEIMCADEPFGISNEEVLADIKALTGRDLYLAWQDLLEKAVIRVDVIGAADTKTTEAAVLKAFSEIKKRSPLPVHTLFVESAEDVTRVTEEMDIGQSKLVLGFRAGMRDNEDHYYALRVMADIFGGGTYSRLFSNVREKLSLCYYCSARLIRDKGVLFVQSGVERKNSEIAEEEILRQLKVMQNGEFTDEEFAASKKAFADAFKSVGDTPESIEFYYAARLNEENPVTIEETAARLAAVTREEVIQAAQAVTLDTVYLLAGKDEDQ